MYRYIVPLLTENVHETQEQALYMIAFLFASHPGSTGNGNIVGHLRRARSDKQEEAVERRFTVLLSACLEDLPDYLRQAISLIQSKDIPVNGVSS